MRSELTPDPGTIVIFSDTWCAFAHVAVHRLHTTRQRLDLDDLVSFDHRAFPMELLNGNPGSRPGSDSEVPSVGSCEPAAGWQLWQDKDWLYPSSTLPALEAVQAAKAQSLKASENLDRALRRAFWTQSRCITNQAVILDVAQNTPGVDATAIREALDGGSSRPAVTEQTRQSAGHLVTCSPHLFLPDGTDHANPGMRVDWEGDWGRGYPRIVHDDLAIYEDILIRSQA